MQQDTEQLIRRLASAAPAVHPLPSPWARAATWCAASLAYLALVYLVWPKHGAPVPSDARFVLEQVAALTTGVAAAIAAFATVVPGYSKKSLIAPVVPLVIWVATVGDSCARELTTGPVPSILAHCACLLATVVAASVPAAAIVLMLRRGAPLTPHLTTALASLAAAGLGNFGIRFVHTLDPGIVVLVWHLVAVFVICIALATLGERIISWRRTLATTGVLSSEV